MLWSLSRVTLDFTAEDWQCFESNVTLHQKIARMADRCTLLKLVHPSEKTVANLASALMSCHNPGASADVLYGAFCDLKNAIHSAQRCVPVITIWDYTPDPQGLSEAARAAAYPDGQPIAKSIDHSRRASAHGPTTQSNALQRSNRYCAPAPNITSQACLKHRSSGACGLSARDF